MGNEIGCEAMLFLPSTIIFVVLDIIGNTHLKVVVLWGGVL